MIYRISIPAERVAVVKELITQTELKNSIKDGQGLIVRLGKESDAKALTEMLRDVTGAVIPYTVED